MLGTLEIRQRGGARVLAGSFPYNRVATVADRGRTRKERVRSRAFGWQLRAFARVQQDLNDAIAEGAELGIQDALRDELARRNVHVLAGHDFNKPLGSLAAGTARVVDGDDAVRFEVDLPDEADMPTHMRDAVSMVRAGLVGGVSPGFRVPPATVVPNAESLTPEPGNPGVMIREINQAVLYELSLVTRPSYASTEVDLRAEDFEQTPPRRPEETLWL